VRYACVLAKVPPSRFGVRGPISVANRAIFTLMQQLTAKEGGTDGVVPTEHQRWGEELFVAAADHLDVLGHFDGGKVHLDWFHSGSTFTRMDFELLWKRVSRVIEEQAEIDAQRAFDSKRARRRIAAIAVGATVAFGSLALWAMN
jgi:hypothetical protein